MNEAQQSGRQSSLRSTAAPAWLQEVTFCLLSADNHILYLVVVRLRFDDSRDRSERASGLAVIWRG